MKSSKFTLSLFLYGFLFFTEGNLFAQQEKKQSVKEELTEQSENLGRLYKDDSNQFLQELWLLGRYHGQYYWARGTEGDENDYESRRIRYGTQARFFEKLTFHAQTIAGSDFSPSYDGFSELWAQWSFMPEFSLTVGQQKHRFTHDRNVSSRYLNYLERAMLTNMFAADYTSAVTAQGEIDKATTYYTGFFSNATGKNIGDAFSDYDSGHSFLAAVYHNLGNVFGTDSAYLYGSYLNSDANEKATNLNNFNNGISSAFIMTEGAFSLVNEITAGLGSENGNAYGINLQPGWFITDSAQLVARYQLAFSNDEDGLQPQKRYEKEVNIQAGDQYQSGYLGLNYYILKQRLKLMHGIEYSQMEDEHVWTCSVMLRFYFGPHSGGAFPMNKTLHGTFLESD